MSIVEAQWEDQKTASYKLTGQKIEMNDSPINSTTRMLRILRYRAGAEDTRSREHTVVPLLWVRVQQDCQLEAGRGFIRLFAWVAELTMLPYMPFLNEYWPFIVAGTICYLGARFLYHSAIYWNPEKDKYRKGYRTPDQG